MDPSTRQQRDTWGSKVAFILAAAGSAIGLGNIWGFPTVAGQNGGAAFLLIYLAAVALIGAPVMLAELIVGRRTQRNPVGAFKALAPGSAWVVVGGLGVLTGIMILSFYSVIAGWTLAYIFKTLAGTFGPETDTGAIFDQLAGGALPAISWHLLFMIITILVVLGGVRDGIERWTKVLMPVLFVLLVLLAVRAVTLSGATAGLEFYLRPDFSKVTGTVVLAAIGQAFFSLSLGMGAMITYGSYVSRRDDLVSSAGWVTAADTTIAILAGLIIFPTLFHAGLEPGAGGPGMVFVVLTSLLSSILRNRLLPAPGHRGAYVQRLAPRGRDVVGGGRAGSVAPQGRDHRRRNRLSGWDSERPGERRRGLVVEPARDRHGFPVVPVRGVRSVLARAGRAADQPVRGLGLGHSRGG
jgi:NSS family neurotransmitter:Na+ symporter